MIKLSFIIPVFNGERCIPILLDSIYAINLPECEYEIIAVDGCSTDNTVNVLQEYSKEHPNLNIIRQEIDTKQGGGRNDGIRVAHGEYITFCDADDRIEPDIVSALNYALEQKVDILCADTLRCGYGDEITLSNLKAPIFKTFEGKEFLDKWIPELYWHAVWGFLFKRGFIIETYRPFVEFRYDEDNDWMAWHLYKAKTIAYAPFTIYRYCYNCSSLIHRKFSAKQVSDSIACAIRRAHIYEILKNDCPNFSRILWNNSLRKYYIDSKLSIPFLASYSHKEIWDILFDMNGHERAFLIDYFNKNEGDVPFPLLHPYIAFASLSIVTPSYNVYIKFRRCLGRLRRKIARILS